MCVPVCMCVCMCVCLCVSICVHAKYFNIFKTYLFLPKLVVVLVDGSSNSDLDDAASAHAFVFLFWIWRSVRTGVQEVVINGKPNRRPMVEPEF